eukprot:CAMPEP_0184418002 /NCGR_PEP_ID=MMETSP0738-20130409/22057_1 /TAXON_ID=385413 /ORGANISM="Thalassiosira miniscula, Strain CCMP1093" /LENGTH=33 /DNA_ID= /DNA_START= /DNA_END= /DNA_ORIENTATION=
MSNTGSKRSSSLPSSARAAKARDSDMTKAPLTA